MKKTENIIYAAKITVIIFLLTILTYAAIGAQWLQVNPQTNWDNSLTGICTESTSCLINPQGNKDKKTSEDYYKKLDPMCINNEDFIEDYYCDNREWTTRTKLSALELLNLAERESQSKYTLHCGTLDEVGIDVDNRLKKSCQKSQTTVSCVNTACALKYDKGTALALIFNSQINDQFDSPLPVFGVKEDYCNNALKSTSFEKCTNGNLKDYDIYYNNKIQSLIYLPKTSSLQSFNQQQFSTNFIKNPFKTVSDYVKAVIHNPPRLNFEFFEQTKLFNKVYIAKSSNTKVFAFLEKTKNQEYLGVKYSGTSISQKHCSELFKLALPQGIFCENQPIPNEFMLVSKEKAITDHWTELTSSLRTK
ncbi:hypothetical protein HZA97_06040 [Candidatus Woesearchaeota archaeon]|nr:hypothetical protein [Candidatus Woesearchaeota archaeon]